MTEIAEPLLPPAWRITLPHAPDAVPMARALVRTALHDLRAAADGDAAELLIAELVTHAVEHTRATHPIHLVVERVTAGCRVAVHDGASRPVDGTGAGEAGHRGENGSREKNGSREESGSREAAGSPMGNDSRPMPDGKAVWFTLPALP
ncbi:ATP-binding protein [Streptomyces natalensis]|uniref:ATP-binding protein n=1 Tax=Streptomyces natalensis ATCC 27448 TaxID=1240678 RepID=A0A0D7CHL2_9ACTN|nr:ATP-binding protein [Streptomyces natalensis]KIZ14907.1 hypothetical protein SNA_31105 [Streptomyces natalensis ATCC 27448]